MARKIDILQYLPEFMQNYLQIRLICKAENVILQRAIDELEIINLNQFILTANSQGLKVFENMLGIVSTSGESLESRRSKVLLKWNDQSTYTYTDFLAKLDIICGEGNYETYEYFSDYALELITFLDKNGQIEQIEELIKYMIPCNILITNSNKIIYDTTADSCFFGCCSFVDNISNSDSYKGTFINSSYTYVKGGYTETEIINIDDSVSHNIDNSNDVYVISSVNNISITDNSDNSNYTIDSDSEGAFVGVSTFIENVEN